MLRSGVSTPSPRPHPPRFPTQFLWVLGLQSLVPMVRFRFREDGEDGDAGNGGGVPAAAGTTGRMGTRGMGAVCRRRQGQRRGWGRGEWGSSGLGAGNTGRERRIDFIQAFPGETAEERWGTPAKIQSLRGKRAPSCLSLAFMAAAPRPGGWHRRAATLARPRLERRGNTAATNLHNITAQQGSGTHMHSPHLAELPP